jgi:hypothetical protein
MPTPPQQRGLSVQVAGLALAERELYYLRRELPVEALNPP